MTTNSTSAAAGATTAAPSPGAVGEILPEFLEVSDVTRIFALRRTSLYELLRAGEIRSVLLRRHGCKTGKRLVVAASIREYLSRELEKQGEYQAGVCNALKTGDAQD